MKNKGQIQSGLHLIVRFALFLFALIVTIMFVYPIFSVSQFVGSDMSCSESFTFMCFVNYAVLPIVFILVILLLIKFLVGDSG